MSTRSATLVYQRGWFGEDDGVESEVMRFYRHCDGYPEGHGLDLARAALMPGPDGEPPHGAGWFQTIFGNLFQMGEWTELWEGHPYWSGPSIEVEPTGTEHGDIEWLYAVCGAVDGGIEMRAWHRGFGVDDGYDALMRDEPEFSGTPEEYLEWLRVERGAEI